MGLLTGLRRLRELHVHSSTARGDVFACLSELKELRKLHLERCFRLRYSNLGFVNSLPLLQHLHFTDNPQLRSFMPPLAGGDLHVGLRMRRIAACLPHLYPNWIGAAAERVQYFRYDRNFLSLAAIKHASDFYRARRN